MNNFDPYKQRTVAEIREDLRAINQLFEARLRPRIDYMRSSLLYWSCFKNSDHYLDRAKYAQRPDKLVPPIVDSQRKQLRHLDSCLQDMIKDARKGFFKRPSHREMIEKMDLLRTDIAFFRSEIDQATEIRARDRREISRREGFYSAVKDVNVALHSALTLLHPAMLVDYKDKFTSLINRYDPHQIYMTDTDILIIIGQWYDGSNVKAFEDIITRFMPKVDGLDKEGEELFPPGHGVTNNYSGGKPVKPK